MINEAQVSNDGLWCPRCGGVFHDAEMEAYPDRFWECPLCHAVQHKACRGPLPDEHEVERVRVLEIMADAMQSAVVAYYSDPKLVRESFIMSLDQAMVAGADALVQLGDLYYRAGDGSQP